MSGGWEPDLLGPGFVRRELPLGRDDGEEIVATLVRSIPTPGRRLLGPYRDVDVLYVHGWSDYFFPPELARFWTARGARFFALDLRRSGTSLRQRQGPGALRRLGAYAEIGRAR